MSIKISKYFVMCMCMAVIYGCQSFVTAHNQFIDSMNALANNTATLDDLADRSYTGRAPASKEYFKKKEVINGSLSKYYFSKESIWGGYCHYYFIVNEETRKVIGWGFDDESGDTRKYCGASG